MPYILGNTTKTISNLRKLDKQTRSHFQTKTRSKEKTRSKQFRYFSEGTRRSIAKAN